MPAGLTWRTARPWLLFGLLGFCVFFIVTEEAVSAIWGENPDSLLESDTLEYIVISALVLGFIASGFEVRHTLNRQRRLEQQIKAASGAFVTLLEEHFEAWELTPSETDVAMLAVKGFSIAEIADFRKTAEGTVKAQCNAIYRKAGVSGRPQLLALFIDELLDGVVEPRQAA